MTDQRIVVDTTKAAVTLNLPDNPPDDMGLVSVKREGEWSTRARLVSQWTERLLSARGAPGFRKLGRELQALVMRELRAIADVEKRIRQGMPPIRVSIPTNFESLRR